MKITKGIILAGGNGSRLYPLTLGTSKQLLPVYDKPMIYYPLSILIQAGIIEILIITTKTDINKFKSLLGDGTSLGIKIEYEIQAKPNGIAESFLIGENFIGSNNVCLILGDNIFHGDNFFKHIKKAQKNLQDGYSSIFGVEVDNPENFGVISLDNNNKLLGIAEKPKNPKSSLIVSGIYFYTNDVVNISKSLTLSSRGEKEITDINNYYISKKKLKLNLLDKSISWIDTGTYSSLIRASKYFENHENTTGEKVSCVEETSFKMGYIDRHMLKKIAISMQTSDYGKYLLKILKK